MLVLEGDEGLASEVRQFKRVDFGIMSRSYVVFAEPDVLFVEEIDLVGNVFQQIARGLVDIVFVCHMLL